MDIVKNSTNQESYKALLKAKLLAKIANSDKEKDYIILTYGEFLNLKTTKTRIRKK